jgi:hypothetical protein
LFKTSQVQPEPKLLIPDSINFSLKFSKFQKSFSIIFAISQVGVFVEFGVKHFQKNS